MQTEKDFEKGQRVFVGAGEQSNGTVFKSEYGNGVLVTLDSDGETVICSPLMLLPLTFSDYCNICGGPNH